MSFLPSVGLYNKLPFIGDNVLLAGIAEALSGVFPDKVYILSQHPELFESHPDVRGLLLDGSDAPEDLTVIDMTESILPISRKGKDVILYQDKLKRMYEQAGLFAGHVRAPRLYLSPEEQASATELRRFFGEKCIAVVLESAHSVKTWPYTRWLIRYLKQRGYDVFVVCDRAKRRHRYLRFYGVHSLIGRSLRELLVYLSMMDLVIGSDTGPMHMALALGVPGVAIGLESFADLYEPYDNCEFVSSGGFTPIPRLGLATKSLRAAVSEAEAIMKKKHLPGLPTIITRRMERIALMLLEGLGGTITLSDTAKKVYDEVGEKVYLVVRKNPELFTGNPYVEAVITIGMEQYEDCVPDILSQFDTVGVIKTGIGKWYQQNGERFRQDFSEWEEIYEAHPAGTRGLERYGLNLIQTANKSLGLPYETIEPAVFNYEDLDTALPPEYIVITNGVDTWHKGMKQTKCWDHEKWVSLVEQLSLPVVQVGTGYDIAVSGAIDLRGRTTIPQLLSCMRDAAAIICTEGGLMHLGYAVGNPNTFVLRGPTRGCFFHYPGQHLIDSYVCHQCYWDTEDWYAFCPREINAICMSSITPERVVRNMEAVLQKGQQIGSYASQANM